MTKREVKFTSRYGKGKLDKLDTWSPKGKTSKPYRHPKAEYEAALAEHQRAVVRVEGALYRLERVSPFDPNALSRAKQALARAELNEGLAAIKKRKAFERLQHYQARLKEKFKPTAE